jgi:thiol-disulfide isomerase/thioredoxin
MRYLLIIFLFISSFAFAQEFNKAVVDSESGKPMLIGNCTLEAFKDTSFSWWWNSAYNLYEVDQETVEKLASELNDVSINIIMGTWCSDSRREVPHLIKILEAAKYPVNDIKIIAVDRDKISEGIDLSKFNIELVPTIIFFKDGKELGRIVESPEETLEKDILKILES